ncbi:2-iminobutanoate/2-iminopropanoate deaminase-like isoform X2 [Gigantopelta aegis]|uniref:2-iminobutanoate/2-iminopropanoate deaminase-like isoform X2 n=1 Tax=Gigantopelta aegis TaxID=1735272 RepID=UPI001B88C314|nr:2-iminobutanoate/2-iminopropanoate deaminase-like isoform X2 [Gigantopelta aegis]
MLDNHQSTVITTQKICQAVIVDKTMYISGQIGFEPSTMEMVPGGVKAEADKVLKNMGAILSAAGISYKNVVKTTVLLQDINDFAAVNEIYATYFTSHLPARAAYQVAALPKGALVEIEAIAVLGDIQDE